MDEKELRDLLSKRLYILRQTKEEIYKSSYKTEVFVNAYEILLEDMEHLGGDTVRGLLRQDSGILESLYQEWITREDSVFEGLRAYIGRELAAAAKAGRLALGKEDRDGKELNKAAQGR